MRTLNSAQLSKMLINYDSLSVMLLLLTYMLIYNITSFLLFITLLQLSGSAAKTLYSFSNLETSHFFTKVLALALLSLAGVPPLLGFFSKIFVFVLLINSSLGTLFVPFFVLVFSGLYFYVQNLRFLHSTNKATPTTISELQSYSSCLYISFALPLSFFLVFGFCYIDDLMLVALWTLL